VDIQTSRRGAQAPKSSSKSKNSASPTKSPARSPAKSKDNSPAAKSGKKSDDEFDFLDEINSTSKLSGSNIASIKQFFGHKATPATSKAKTATTAMGASAKKFASGKHSSARDPSPQRARAGSEDTDSDADDYRTSHTGYGGAEDLDNEDDVEPEDREDGQDGAEEDAAALQAHWNLATYLPDAAAQYFHFVTGTWPLFVFTLTGCESCFATQFELIVAGMISSGICASALRDYFISFLTCANSRVHAAVQGQARAAAADPPALSAPVRLGRLQRRFFLCGGGRSSRGRRGCTGMTVCQMFFAV
jgi:hypothetical protein